MSAPIVEVWDNTNTLRLGELVLAELPVVREVLRQETSFQVAAKLGAGAAGAVARGTVLRLAAEGSTEISAWRTLSRTPALDASGGSTLRIQAVPLWTDLQFGIISDPVLPGRSFSFGRKGLSPAAYLSDIILPAYAGTAAVFGIGVVEPTTPLDLTFSKTRPLAGVGMLLEALQRLLGVGEAQYRQLADGRTYLIDILNQVGRRAGGAVLEYGKNIRESARTEQDGEVANVLYGVGGADSGLTLDMATWRVLTVAGTSGAVVVTFQTPSPVYEDGCLVGRYFAVKGKAPALVASSSLAAGTVTLVASIALFAPDDEGAFTTDALGAHPVFRLESPSSIAAFGGERPDVVEASDIPEVFNLVRNADLTLAVGGFPQHATKLGAPRVTQTSDVLYAHVGASAWIFEATQDGQGILFDPITIVEGEDPLRPYHGILALLTLVLGRVRIELRHSNGKTYPTTQRLVNGTAGYQAPSMAPIDENPLPSGTARLAVVAHEGPAKWALDGVLLSRVRGEVQLGYATGNAASEMWARRVAPELARRREPKVEWHLGVADLEAADPVRYARERLQLGDDVPVVVPRIGVETLRIVDREYVPGDASRTTVNVAPGPDARLYDPWRPSYPGEQQPGTPGFGEVPRVRQSRFAVTHRVIALNSFTDTLRLDFDDPDAELASTTFAYRVADGPDQGPFAPLRSGGSWAEFDVPLDDQHNVYAEYTLTLRSGRLIQASTGALDRDRAASPVGMPTISGAAAADVAQEFDSDTVRVWVEEQNTSDGTWGAATEVFGGPPVFAFSVPRYRHAVRVFRIYGENGAGEVNIAGAREFVVDRDADIDAADRDLGDFRVTQQSDGSELWEAKKAGPAVAAVWGGAASFPNPAVDEHWDELMAAPDDGGHLQILSSPAITIPAPPPGYYSCAFMQSATADLVKGRVRRRILGQQYNAATGLRISSVFADGHGTASVVVNVDEAVPFGPGAVQHQVSSGPWEDDALWADRSAVFDVAQTAEPQTIAVRCVRSIAADGTRIYGTPQIGAVPAYIPTAPMLHSVGLVVHDTGAVGNDDYTVTVAGSNMTGKRLQVAFYRELTLRTTLASASPLTDPDSAVFNWSDVGAGDATSNLHHVVVTLFDAAAATDYTTLTSRNVPSQT